MRLTLLQGFQREVRALDDDQRAAVFDAVLQLPRVIAEPHLHAGLGVRKVHRTGIWEARVGLGLRMVFGLDGGAGGLILIRVGSHDDVRRCLRSL